MISRTTKTTFNEAQGIRLLQEELEKNNRIKTYFSENDRTPNTDGYFEILDESGFPLQRFVVQIKSTEKVKKLITGGYRYQAKSAFFYYVLETIDRNPAMFIVVDMSSKTLFYKYLSLKYLLSLSIGNKKTVSMHFNESNKLTEERFYKLCRKIVRKKWVEESRSIGLEIGGESNIGLPPLPISITVGLGDEPYSINTDISDHSRPLEPSDNAEHSLEAPRDRSWIKTDKSPSVSIPPVITDEMWSDDEYQYPFRLESEESRLLNIPESIRNHYDKISLIGQGGTSRVYLLESTEPHFKRALKVSALRDSDRLPLLNEFNFIESLRHPSIPRVLDYYIENGHEYLLMDYIEGMDLDYLSNNNAMDLHEVLAIIIQLCGIVSYINARGIVHGDLKPSNIFIRKSSGLTLLDFGCAEKLNQEEELTGHMVVTPKYTAPEILSLHAHKTLASEIYSIGATLYYSLINYETAHFLRSGFTDYELSEYIKDYSGKELGEGLAILQKALAFRPEDRYESVTDLEEDLLIWQRSEFLHPSVLNQTMILNKNKHLKDDN